MATRTFVADGTSRAWSLTTTWAEGIVPTAADDVVFSTNVASSILVIDGTSGSPSLCRSIDTTNYTKTITFGASKQINVGDGTTGAFKMTAGMTFAPNASSLVKFVSTTTGNNITFGGYAFGLMTFDGVGGAWTFQDANSMVAASTLTLTNGSVNTNSQTQTNAINFSSNNSNTRTFTLGTTNFKLATAAGTSWDITTSTGMTLSAASSTITAANTTSMVTFQGGGLTYGTLTSTAVTSGSLSIFGTNTFGTLTLSLASGTPSNTTGYIFYANQVVSGTFTSNGFSVTDRNFIFSDTQGTQRTITCNGTVTVTSTDFRDIVGAGSASWNLSAITGGSGNCGGNSGITFNTPKNCYMKTAVSVSWNGSNWFTTSGGSTPISPVIPLIQDTAIFDANSVTVGSKTITVNMARIPAVNWTGILNTPAFGIGSASFEIYGAMVLDAGMTVSGSGTCIFSGRGSFNITSANLTWPATGVQLNANGATYTLQNNFAITTGGSLTMVDGTLALNGFNLSMAGCNVTFNGGVLSGTGTITAQAWSHTGGTVTLGGTCTLTSTMAISGGTFNNNSYGVTGHTTYALSGGICNLSGQFNGSGAMTLSGGTTNDSGTSGEYKGTTFSCTGGTHTLRKVTASSTWAQSSTGSITIPAGGTATWETSWTWTGITYTFITNGSTTWASGALSIAAIGAVKMAGDGGGFVG